MTEGKNSKVPISERALLQRINRRLAEDHEVVRKTRARRRDWGVEYPQGFGKYYRLDFGRNLVFEQDLDLAEFGKELGVLRDWEELVEEEE